MERWILVACSSSAPSCATGSIGAGARELGWTQPAVSQHLAALEKEVGTQLQLRSSSGITPTEAGGRLAAHAEAIAAQLHAAEEELADITALRRGTVKFGTFPSAAAVLLPPVLAHLAATAPDLEVTFSELEPPDAIPAVREGALDLALVFRYPCSDIDDEGTLEWTPLLEDRVMAVLPREHPRAEDPDLTLADLAEDPWIAGCERCRANLLSSARQGGLRAEDPALHGRFDRGAAPGRARRRRRADAGDRARGRSPGRRRRGAPPAGPR